jgi:hypothetical protein
MNHDTSALAQALQQWQPAAAPTPIFRLYHDSQGRPLRYSMQDEPGEYIEITCEQYHRASSKARVRQGRLEIPTAPPVSKLRPHSAGILCHAQDITVVIKHGTGQHWRLNHEED